MRASRIFSYVLYLLTGLVLLFTTKIYFDRIVGFSFGDEWNNFILAYFMGKGKTLYSEIFINHQMLIAYISFLLQALFRPNTLYKLVFIHRVFLIIYSVCFDVILLIRFKKKAIGFIIAYELTKYYVFGTVFLAESFLVYPIVYLFFLCVDKLKGEKIHPIEIVISGILTWFIVFMREPYIPLGCVLYAILLWKYTSKKIIIISLMTFVLLSVGTILTVPLKDYIQQVFLFNFSIVIPYETSSSQTSGIGVLKILFYPLFVFFWGKWNFFREILIGSSLLYVLFGIYLLMRKRFTIFFFCFFILILAGLRIVPPGTVFYEAFHMNIWYAVFIAVIVQFLFEIIKISKKEIAFVTIGLFILWNIFLLSSQSFIWEKFDKNTVFTINYALYYTNGQVIKDLASKNDTLFADLWDYLIYWQSGLMSSYKYSIYTFVMEGYKPFQDARIDMFRRNSPDFYYTYCSKGIYESELLPNFVKNEYVELNHNGKPSCLYIKKEKIAMVSKKSRSDMAQLGFSLPQ